MRILLVGLVLALSGCGVTRSVYELRVKYVGPTTHKEAREMDLFVSGKGFSRNIVLQDFPRVFDRVYEKMITGFKGGEK